MLRLKGRYSDSNVIVKLLQWLAAIVLLTAIVLAVWTIVPDKQSTAALKTLQALQSLATFLLPPIVTAYLWSHEPKRWLHLDTGISGKQAALAVLTMVVAIPAINLLAWLNSLITLPYFLEGIETWMKQMEEQAALLTERFLNTTAITGLCINLIVMAAIPAAAEELTFRGTLQNLFSPDRNSASPRATNAAIWAVAILFSAIHMQFYGFIPRMLLGALFGYALLWSRSLWLPMLMHLTNNALAVIFAFVCFRQDIDISQTETIGTGDTLWLGCISITLTAFCITLLYRSCREKNRQTEKIT